MIFSSYPIGVTISLNSYNLVGLRASLSIMGVSIANKHGQFTHTQGGASCVFYPVISLWICGALMMSIVDIQSTADVLHRSICVIYGRGHN